MRGKEASGAVPGDGSGESPRFTWTMAGVLFGVGASIGALSLLVPHPESFDDSALWSNVAISYAGALACLIGARLLPIWPLHIAVAAGVVFVTRAAYYSGDPDGFYTMFYVWIGLFVVFFFSRWVAALYIGAIGVAYGWLLFALDASAVPARWVTTIGTVALGALLIDLLVRRIRGMAHESAALARERAALLATMAVVARTDDLTGLPNRRAWDESLDQELARAARESTPLCVGLVDMDRFKEYNDDHGHQRGDLLLKEIAVAWRVELRATDIVARYGGEEFALALPGCDLDDACAMVERLRAATPGEQTCSAGLVLWDGQESAEYLFGRADKALYAAKEAGRDRTVVT